MAHGLPGMYMHQRICSCAFSPFFSMDPLRPGSRLKIFSSWNHGEHACQVSNIHCNETALSLLLLLLPALPRASELQAPAGVTPRDLCRLFKGSLSKTACRRACLLCQQAGLSSLQLTDGTRFTSGTMPAQLAIRLKAVKLCNVEGEHTFRCFFGCCPALRRPRG